MSAPKDEVPPPTVAFTTPGADAEGLEIDARFLTLRNDAFVLIMPASGWSALLDTLRAASEAPDADPDLATWYAGLKHGFGFLAPEELMGPERPEITS